MAAAPAISVSGLTKAYSQTTGIFDVDLEVPGGTVMALLGPNGAGKTTTLRILSTLLRPDRGTVRVGGFDALTQPDRVQALIGVANQASAIDEKLSGRVNLNMFARLHRLSWKTTRQRTAELLERFRSHRALARSSAVTRAGCAASSTSLSALSAARPSSSSTSPRPDSTRPAVTRSGTSSAGSSKTAPRVLLTTQYLDEADALADRVTFIDGGRVIARGTPAELKARIGGRHAEFALASADEASQLAPGSARSRQLLKATACGCHRRSAPDLARLMLAVEHAGVEPVDYQVRTPSLDDVYFALTGHDHAEQPAKRGGRPMSAAVAERPPSRWWVLSDYFEMVKRSLRHIANDPDQLVTVTLQPVLTLTIMDFFIGGAIKTGTRQDYLDFVLPGIFIVMAGFAAVTTALGVASDMLQGVVDRFRTLPMAKSAVVAGYVISDLPRALIGLAVTIGVGLLIGFRSPAGPARGRLPSASRCSRPSPCPGSPPSSDCSARASRSSSRWPPSSSSRSSSATPWSPPTPCPPGCVSSPKTSRSARRSTASAPSSRERRSAITSNWPSLN